MAEAEEEGVKKKKKKARWRDQRENTVVISQLPFSADRQRIEDFLRVKCGQFEISQVRLVTDKAIRSQVTERKHAGLAYVVTSSPEALCKRIDGIEMDSRKLGAKLLREKETDESGRVTLPQKIGRTGAEALAKRAGLDFDERLCKALGRTSHFVAATVIRDAAKKKNEVENISAYARGVLNRLNREHVVAKTTPLENKERKKALSIAQVDTLLADFTFSLDDRARDYLREFTKPHALTALNSLARVLQAPDEKTTKHRKKRKRDTHQVASASAFLMGILRDLAAETTLQKRSPSSASVKAPRAGQDKAHKKRKYASHSSPDNNNNNNTG